MQRGVQDRRIALQVVAQALGHGKHPLPHRQAGNAMQGEMRGGLDHSPGGAGRTDATTFAGIRDQEVMPAVGAARPGKTMGEDAAFQIAAEFPLGDAENAATGAVIVQRQPGRQMLLHGAVEQGAFRSPPAIDGSPRGRGVLRRRMARWLAWAS